MDKNKVGGPPVPYGAKFGQHTSGQDIPENAVFLTQNDVLSVVLRTISKWSPQSDMWPFMYGNAVIAGAAAISGIVFNAHLRNKFRLGSFGPFLTFAPTCLIPTITTVILQDSLVMRKMALREFDCPACAQIRSATLMVSTGMIQPCLLSLFACSVIAKTRATIALPPVNSRKILTVYANMLKPLRITLLGLFLMNVSVGVFLTEQQAQCIAMVHERMSKGI